MSPLPLTDKYGLLVDPEHHSPDCACDGCIAMEWGQWARSFMNASQPDTAYRSARRAFTHAARYLADLELEVRL